jgi:hypothetical protein
MMAMDWLAGRGFNLLSIVIAILALIAGSFRVLYGRRALFSANREISYRLETSRLLAGDAHSLPGALAVSYEGQLLRDPYVVKLRLRNTGRHAVASDRYDQGRPIQFDLGHPAILLDSSANSGFRVEGSQVSFGPELLPAGGTKTLSLLTEGKPCLTVNHYFIDTEVTNESPESDTCTSDRQVRSAVVAATGGAVAALMSVVVTFLSSDLLK